MELPYTHIVQLDNFTQPHFLKDVLKRLGLHLRLNNRAMAVIKAHSLKSILAAVMSLVCMGFSCDKTVDPIEPKDYILYSYNSGVMPQAYYAYHTLSGNLDTFDLIVQPAAVSLNQSPLAVTPNGELLFIATTSGNVSIINSVTYQVIRQLPYDATEVQVSSDGKHLAIHGWRHQLWILESENYNLVYFDSGSYSGGRFRSGRFAQSGETYYCSDQTDSGDFAYQIDFTKDSVPSFKGFNASIIQLLPSPDEAHLYLYLHHGNFIFEFADYDVAGDSIIFSDVFSPGSGWIDITPDGRYVFYTYPGGMIGPPPTRYSLSVYDSKDNMIAKIVPGIFVDSAGDTSLFRPAELAVTPDGRSLVAVQVDGVGRFQVIDVKKLEITRYFESNIIEMIYLAIQSKP